MALTRKRRTREKKPNGEASIETSVPEARAITFPPLVSKKTGVQDGDIFKHYVEHDVYCVLITDDENIKYATMTNTTSWGQFKGMKHEEMIRGALTMSKSNADAIIKEGKWIHVGNIVKSWGG